MQKRRNNHRRAICQKRVVEATVLSQIKDKKVIVFKKKEETQLQKEDWT